MDLGNEQIWKGNLVYQQVSQNLMLPTATPCAAQEVQRPQSCCFTPSTAVVASPAPSPSPFPVIPDWGFAFCSNKENVIKNLLTLVQREAAIAAVTAGEWVELSVPLLFSAPSWKQPREGLTVCPSGTIPRDLSEPSVLWGVH